VTNDSTQSMALVLLGFDRRTLCVSFLVQSSSVRFLRFRD